MSASDVGTSQALSIVLLPQRELLAVGTLPHFSVAIRNTSSQGVRVCRYMLQYRLLVALKAEDTVGHRFSMQVFKRGEFKQLQADDLVRLEAGQELKETLPLASLLRDEFGMVPDWSQPSVIPPGHGLTGFPEGTYDFWTAFHDKMGIYRGSNGVQDGNWEVRAIPQQLPGAAGEYSDVFRGDIEAHARVTFQ